MYQDVENVKESFISSCGAFNTYINIFYNFLILIQIEFRMTSTTQSNTLLLKIYPLSCKKVELTNLKL